MDWMKLSHLLPYPLRVVAASLKGFYLNWWRYSRNTEALVQQALERETWSRERWKAWQEERLSYVLHRAATQIPYYREYWQQRRKTGGKASWEVLEHWPILKKEQVRNIPQAFIADNCHPGRMYNLHTSGTTGTPLSLWQSRETVQRWYALFEARWRRWYGVSRHDRWAILGGQLVTPVSQKKPPFWVWNAGLSQLYMSSYHLALDNILAYFDAMRHYRVRYVWGYASSLYSLAQTALDQELDPPQLEVAISNAEPLYAHQRQAISKAFDCPVYTTYGMTEAVCAASECESGTLHLWPEVGMLEVLDDETDEPLPSGETGRLICTGLLNADMPFIRYEVGDRGAIAPSDTICSCGRTLPILEKVEGRMDDVILTSDGRRIGRLDPVFKGEMPIREAQIIQEQLDLLRVRFVPEADYSPANEKVLIRRLRERVGDVDVRLEPVNRIPRTANGKFRAVINKLEKQ